MRLNYQGKILLFPELFNFMYSTPPTLLVVSCYERKYFKFKRAYNYDCISCFHHIFMFWCIDLYQ